MDTVTHVLFGSLIARVIAPHETKPGNSFKKNDPLFITAFAGAFPDIDYLSFWINPLLFLAEWHRSITHSLFMVPLWGVVLTVFFLSVLPRLRGCAKMVFLYSVAGLVSHIFLDILTVYGTEIFYPFSDRLISLAITFVIDPYFTVVVAITLFISLNMRSRPTAITGIVLILIYLSFQWQVKQDAIKISEGYGNNQIDTYSDIIALPQPFSPFHWRVIVRNSNEYSTALLDITGLSEKIKTGHEKNSWLGMISAYHSPTHLYWEHYSLLGTDPDKLSLINEVWLHDDFSLFRQFAVFPVLYRVDAVNGGACVWFTDLRYFISTMLPSFRYGMCRNKDDSNWQLYRLRRFTENNRQLINPM